MMSEEKRKRSFVTREEITRAMAALNGVVTTAMTVLNWAVGQNYGKLRQENEILNERIKKSNEEIRELNKQLAELKRSVDEPYKTIVKNTQDIAMSVLGKCVEKSVKERIGRMKESGEIENAVKEGAKEAFKEEERKYFGRIRRNRYWFAGAALAASIMFAGSAYWIARETRAVDIVKVRKELATAKEDNEGLRGNFDTYKINSEEKFVAYDTKLSEEKTKRQEELKSTKEELGKKAEENDNLVRSGLETKIGEVEGKVALQKEDIGRLTTADKQREEQLGRIREYAGVIETNLKNNIRRLDELFGKYVTNENFDKDYTAMNALIGEQKKLLVAYKAEIDNFGNVNDIRYNEMKGRYEGAMNKIREMEKEIDGLRRPERTEKSLLEKIIPEEEKKDNR